METDSIGCRTIINLRFTDGIDGFAGEKENLAKPQQAMHEDQFHED